MPTKFQCHYKLSASWTDVNGQKELYTVTDPISIQFNISKVSFQSDNNATIIVTNMDGAVREALYQDKIIFDPDMNKRKMITLEAGYGEKLTMICLGWINECYSIGQGADVQTIIEVIDPDILSEYCSVTFEPGTSFEEAYKYLVSQMPNLKMGELGNLQGNFQVPTVFDGNAFVAINKLTGQHTFIDNGVIHTLNDNEALSNYDAYLIEGETGLLETPRRREAILEVVMLFEPTLRIGQIVEIKASKTDDNSTIFKFNGQYKIVELQHNCTISNATGGTRTTTLHLLYIDYAVNSNVNLTQKPSGSPVSVVKNKKIEPLNLKISSGANYVFNFIMENAGKIPNRAINSIISWKDMLGHNNQDSERVADLTKGKVAACEAIANRVMEFRDKYFSGKQVIVTSGWRSIANNKREGGVSNSQHLKGTAMDLKIIGVSPGVVASRAKSSGMFKYVKPYSTWVHVDVRS